MVTEYTPKRGDIIWISFNPQAGHEQAGRRPALVLSPEIYNARTGLSLCVPLTAKVKNLPFEVPLPTGLPISGVILSDHIKNLDWKARNADYICDVDEEIITNVLEKLKKLL
ncbi:endoribonuclease MazF [Siminovitchia sp. 179-K 8D1 HS]|uniref:endoribonuclease MazF n=1 Tax=Siminovitchia sp. 179-K 8D1 HS TaxID=3142385 RepID=UPI0039A20E7F